MYRLQDIIGGYEEAETITIPGMNKPLPIESPQGLDWTVRKNPNRLTKMFNLSDESDFNAFLMDVLEHQAETGHHGRLTVQFPQVKIEVWTHDLNDITEVDMEWAQTVQEIYEGYDE